MEIFLRDESNQSQKLFQIGSTDKYAEESDSHVLAIQGARGPCLPGHHNIFIVDHSGTVLLCSVVKAVSIAAPAISYRCWVLVRRHVQAEGRVSGNTDR